MTTLWAFADTRATLDEVVWANDGWWPLWLLVPLAVGAFVWAGYQRRRTMTKLGGHEVLARLVASVHNRNRILAAVAVVLGLACLVTAVLRPQYGGRAKVVPASGLDVVLVVDYSKSMLAEDVYPSRSERLEAELSRFLEDADERGDRVGVVVFAGQARGFPLTRDMRMLDLYLDRADPRTENPGGTAIGKGLKLALAFLVDARRNAEGDVPEGGEVPVAENDQVIILLTDGEDTDSRPLEVAAEAAKLGVQIYTVGIGSASGEPIPAFDEQGQPAGFVTDEQGNYVMTRIDEPLLRQLAQETGGRFVKVDPKQFGLDEVRDLIGDLSATRPEDTIQIHREEGFPFFVAPAVLLLSLSLALSDRRRRGA